MILDSHAYCFPPADAPAGHASGAAHLRWVQAAHAGHHQPAWRVRDRSPPPSRVLDPEGRYVRSTLPDVNFRVDREATTLRGSGETLQVLRARRVGGFRVRATRFHSRVLRVVRELQNRRLPDHASRGGSVGVFLKLPCFARPLEWYLPAWPWRGRARR